MPLFNCPICSQSIDAEEDLSGEQVACPACASPITVPGGSPYRVPASVPRRPAFTVHDAPTDHESPNEEKAGLKWPLIATLAAFVAGLMGSFMQPHVHGLDAIILRSIGHGLGIVVVAGIVALIAAGIWSAFQNPFRPALARAYAVGVGLVAGLSLLGSLLNQPKGSAREAAPGFSQSEARRARETLTKLQADLKQVQELPAAPGAPGKTPPVKFESEIQGNETFDKIGRLVREMLTEMAAVKQTYMADLDHAGISRLLSAERRE